MIDIHYTPTALAEAMVESLPDSFKPKSIADFSAGEGALLLQAQSRWRDALIYANDICKSSVRRLKKYNPTWAISCSNFLSESAHIRTKFSYQKNKIDLILLNPPFSERGRSRIESEWFSDIKWTAGLATTFIFLSLNYLSDKGYLVAILPDGSLASLRDMDGWDLMRQQYSIEVLKENPINSFSGAVARTSLVKITRNKYFPNLNNSKSLEPVGSIKVHRGTIQMHLVKPADIGFRLVHTSNLRFGKVSYENAPLVNNGVKITGPAILFPRVGRVSPQKVSILEDGCEVVLSDCILAINCKSIEAASSLKEQLLSRWDEFYSLYRGTGAPYITVSRASYFFESLSLKESLLGIRDAVCQVDKAV